MPSKTQNHIYYTTTLPYVNANPHLGHALEFVHADICARYSRLKGKEVFLNIGTDEHGQKVWQKAIEEGKEPQAYVDEYAERFQTFAKTLNISHDRFIRTTDEDHIHAAQEFWRRCNESGDIYKKEYKVKYCVGCELEKTDSELNTEGRCDVHPDKELEIREEENYFFRFSKYADTLLDLYTKNPDFVLPESRLNEIKSFVERGLQDFSISRLKQKMPWGIPVPDDKEHVMYVWFDALVNYISAIGWPENKEEFEAWWPVIQFAGKDNLRQQSAMWQAMLMSAGIEPSKQVIIHGFINSGGQKMSKSIGNVVDPLSVAGEYGVDALRYYLAREVTPFEDGDFTDTYFKETYNANLANGLGNLSSRILKMAASYLDAHVSIEEKDIQTFTDYCTHMDAYKINEAADVIWEHIGALDARITETAPFKLIKTDEQKAKEIVKELVQGLHDVTVILEPIMPETAHTIRAHINENTSISTPLFSRK